MSVRTFFHKTYSKLKVNCWSKEGRQEIYGVPVQGFRNFSVSKRSFSSFFANQKMVLSILFKKQISPCPSSLFSKTEKSLCPTFRHPRVLTPLNFLANLCCREFLSHCPLFKTQRIALSPFFQKPKKSMPSFLKTEGSVDKPARVPSKPARVPNEYCPIP